MNVYNFPLISVLIPVYQVEQYLHRCLDSVLRQTYPNLEIVMVDDGSTDASGEIGKEYANLPNVEYIFSEHLGVSYARQLLLNLAKGDYLFFLDSDDYIDPNAIKFLFNLAETHHADIAQCTMQNTSTDIMPSVKYDLGTTEVHCESDMLTQFCCGGLGLFRCTLAAKLYKPHVFKNVNFPVGKINEDEYTMHRIVFNCHKIVCSSLPLYFYYENSKSIMKKQFSYERYDALAAIEDRIYYCQSNDLPFAADVSKYFYCQQCLELYRSTYSQYGSSDPNLQKLLKKYTQKARYLISLPWITEKLKTALKAWETTPMNGWVPRIYQVGKELYESYRNMEGGL